jgi:hypothetical protein
MQHCLCHTGVADCAQEENGSAGLLEIRGEGTLHPKPDQDRPQTCRNWDPCARDQEAAPGRLNMDRLGAMKTFVRVIETGSFSAAAKYLNVG